MVGNWKYPNVVCASRCNIFPCFLSSISTRHFLQNCAFGFFFNVASFHRFFFKYHCSQNSKSWTYIYGIGHISVTCLGSSRRRSLASLGGAGRDLFVKTGDPVCNSLSGWNFQGWTCVLPFYFLKQLLMFLWHHLFP